MTAPASACVVRVLLVGWAAKEAHDVSEDELAAELHATGEAEWR